MSIPLINGGVWFVGISIVDIGNSNVMFISNCKIFNVATSGGVYGLEKEELSGGIVHFVNERVGAEAIIVIISVSESKKHTSIDSELFNAVGCFG